LKEEMTKGKKNVISFQRVWIVWSQHFQKVVPSFSQGIGRHPRGVGASGAYSASGKWYCGASFCNGITSILLQVAWWFMGGGDACS